MLSAVDVELNVSLLGAASVLGAVGVGVVVTSRISGLGVNVVLDSSPVVFNSPEIGSRAMLAFARLEFVVNESFVALENPPLRVSDLASAIASLYRTILADG